MANINSFPIPCSARGMTLPSTDSGAWTPSAAERESRFRRSPVATMNHSLQQIKSTTRQHDLDTLNGRLLLDRQRSSVICKVNAILNMAPIHERRKFESSSNEKSPTQFRCRVQIRAEKDRSHIKVDLGRHGSQSRCTKCSRWGNAISSDGRQHSASDSDVSLADAQRARPLLTHSIGHHTTASATQQTIMADENDVKFNTDAPASVIATREAPTEQRKPRAKKAVPETAPVEIAMAATPALGTEVGKRGRQTRGRKPKAIAVASAKSTPMRHAPKTDRRD